MVGGIEATGDWSTKQQKPDAVDTVSDALPSEFKLQKFESPKKLLEVLLDTPDYPVTIEAQQAFVLNADGEDPELTPPGYLLKVQKLGFMNKLKPVDSVRIETALKRVCKELGVSEPDIRRLPTGVYIGGGTATALAQAFDALGKEALGTMFLPGDGPSLDMQIKANFVSALSGYQQQGR